MFFGTWILSIIAFVIGLVIAWLFWGGDASDNA
jgi:hypothetical protein